jgi:ATP/ADP translocase
VLLGLCQGALIAFGSMAGALPFTAVFYIAVCLTWLKATLDLAKTMDGTEEEKKVTDCSEKCSTFSPSQ